MKRNFTILIGDRNKNIRDFLRREFTAEGYDVRLAKDGREILNMVNCEDPPDLLIMDIFVQVVDGLIVLEKLQELTAHIPVVIYTSLIEYKDDPIIKKAEAFIEKEGQISTLKTTVFDLLVKSYPRMSKGDLSWKCTKT